MATSAIRSALRNARQRLRDPDGFLKNVSGVIHVGANEGQEREKYAARNLRVLWIEPIPSVFARLTSNIAKYDHQEALQALLTDVDGQHYNFNIANNGGASSSIFELELHKEIWPEISYSESVELVSTTLSRLTIAAGVDVSRYQALVLDTQGSELLVLKGAEELLKNFQYIKTEAPDFAAYKGCCDLAEISSYLRNFGFTEVRRSKFAGRKDIGNYYDIVYARC